MKIDNLSSILYVIAGLLVFIPIYIVLLTDEGFSSTFSNFVVNTALVLIILGKVITITNKSKKDKSIPKDIGTIIGILIVLGLHL